jgi:hypothetical protein
MFLTIFQQYIFLDYIIEFKSKQQTCLLISIKKSPSQKEKFKFIINNNSHSIILIHVNNIFIIKNK